MIGDGAFPDVTNGNTTGYLYLSPTKRIAIDIDTGIPISEKLVAGIWQPGSFKAGPETFWLGFLGLEGSGHHFATKAPDGHIHYFSYSESDGELTTHDAQIVNEYNYEARRIFQSDESTTYTGKNIEFSFPSDIHLKTENIYYKTGSIVPTTPVRIQIWEGTDDTGTRVFNQYYPPIDFIADSEIQLAYNGFVEYDAGQTYFLRYSCDTDFSLKADATTTYLWFAADVTDLREDDMLQIRSYDSRADGVYSFTSGEDWAIYNKKIYICNATGPQTGTFASNIAKWDTIGAGGGGGGYLARNGTTLRPVNAGDDIATTGALNIGTGTLSGQKVLIQDDTVDSTTILTVKNANTGNASANIQAISGIGGVNLRAWADTGSDNAGQVWLDAFNNTGDLVIKSHTGIEFRTGINTTSMTVTPTTYQVGNSTDNISQNNNSFIVKSIGQLRFVIDSGNSRLYPADMQGYFKIDNTSLAYNDGTRDKLKVQADTSTTGFYYIDDNGVSRIQSGSDHTAMTSPGTVSSFTTIQVMENTVDLKIGLSSRQTINTAMTKFWDNASGTLILQDGTLIHKDGTRNRITADDSKIELVTPSGSKKFTLTDAGGAVMSGPIVAEDGFMYWGDPNTDGSWKVHINGSGLDFDRRASGVYNFIGGFA